MRVKINQPFDEQRFTKLKLEAVKLLFQLNRYHGARIHDAGRLHHFLTTQVKKIELFGESYYETTEGPCKGYKTYRTLDSLEKYIIEARRFLK